MYPLRWKIASAFLCLSTVSALGQNAATVLTRSESELQLAEARELENAGNYEASLKIYSALKNSVSRPATRQAATVFAGNCLAQLKRYDEAIIELDSAILLNTKADWTITALLNKALLCEKMGKTELALQAVYRLRAEFPDSTAARQDSMDLLGRLQGFSATKLSSSKQGEIDAYRLLRDARQQLYDSKYYDGALMLLGRLITDFPETASAEAALLDNAVTLQHKRMYEEACKSCIALIEKVKPLAPDSEIVNKAEYELAEATFHKAETLYDNAIKGSEEPAAEYWEQIRVYCKQVLKAGRNPRQMAEVKVILIALELVENRAERASEMCRAFAREYDGPKKLKKFPKQILTNYLYSSIAARATRRPDVALNFLESAEVGFNLLDSETRKNDRIQKTYRQICYRKFQLLVETNADRADIKQAGQLVIDKFPDSEQAVGVKRVLAATTQPPP